MSPALLVLGTLLAARPVGVDALRVALAAERPGMPAPVQPADTRAEPSSPSSSARPADGPRAIAAARRAEATRERERARSTDAAAAGQVAPATAAPVASPSASSPPGRASDAAPAVLAPARAELAPASQPVRPWAWFLPGGALLLLAGGAVLAARKRQAASRWIQILETSSLGPKRSLVVAQVGDQTLVLGVSESGISLLTTTRSADRTDFETPPASALARSTAEHVPELAAAPAAADEPEHPVPNRPVPVLRADEDLFGGAALAPAPRPRPLLRAVPPARNLPPPPFGDLLIESAEDQELRRKLALGLTGSVS